MSSKQEMSVDELVLGNLEAMASDVKAGVMVDEGLAREVLGDAVRCGYSSLNTEAVEVVLRYLVSMAAQ